MEVNHINGEGNLIAELLELLHQNVGHVKKCFVNIVFLFYFVFLFLGNVGHSRYFVENQFCLFSLGQPQILFLIFSTKDSHC